MASKKYRIDVGNSNTGPVGFVAYVKAQNKKDALKKLSEAIGTGHKELDFGEGVKVVVFFNAGNVGEKDVQPE